MSVEGILYQVFLYGVPVAIYVGVIGFRWREGLWSNILAFFAVLFSIFFAIGWWEWLAEFLAQNVYGGGLFFWDYAAIWLIYMVSFVIIDTLSRSISRTKVKFPIPVENSGNALLLVVLATMIYLFFLFTVDLSPIGEKKDAVRPDKPALLSDICRTLSKNNLQSFYNPQTFDADGKMNVRHFERRVELMKYAAEKDSKNYEGTIPPRRNR